MKRRSNGGRPRCMCRCCEPHPIGVLVPLRGCNPFAVVCFWGAHSRRPEAVNPLDAMSKPAGRMRKLLPALLILGACATQRSEFGTPVSPAEAALVTGIAVGAAAASRAAGGCYAVCSYGTVCNPQTGYCDVLPCRGLCTADQECDMRGPIHTCVPRSAADLKIVTDPSAPLTPR